MYDIIENIIIMILTIVVLVGGGYLVLVLLNWGLKLKGGTREEEGLVELWAAAKKEHRALNSTDPSTDNSQQ
jgi:hypothetical protein